MISRRDFGKSLVATGAVLALPSVGLAKLPVDHTWDGPHLAEFDYNDALFSTAQKAFGTLWYGDCRPEVILSPSRVVGRIWHAMMPRARVKVNRPLLYSTIDKTQGLMFSGAIWISNDYLTDEIVLVNDRYIRDADHHTWKKFNGWYRASQAIIADPFGDECFRNMQGWA